MRDEFFIFILFVVFGAFEHFHPAQPKQTWAGRLRNIFFGIFVLTVGAFLAALVFDALPLSPRDASTQNITLILLHTIAYAAIYDFFFYWYHRAQHKFYGLWQVHELHHSDDELNVTSSFRTYFLDYPLQAVFVAAPTYLIIGYDPKALSLFILGALLLLTWSHANVRIEHGRLTSWIVGPQLHRIHHSNQSQHRDKNFAQYFPIYDILFGTYYAPTKGEFPETGTETLASRADLTTVFIKPFVTWRRFFSRSKGK